MELEAYVLDILTRSWPLLVCFVLILSYFYNSTTKRPENFPPGPKGFPFLGVAPLVGRRPDITFTKWGRKYGNVIGFKVGSNLTVVLNSYDAIHDALVKQSEIFSDRPDNHIFTNVLKKKGVSVNDYTPEYIVERKFTHATLRRLCFGERKLETSVIGEAECYLKEFENKDFELNDDAKKLLLYAAGNIIAQVMFGKRYATYQDPELRTIMDGLDVFLRKRSVVYMAAMIFPWLYRIPPIRGCVKAMRRGLDQVSKVTRKQIDLHEESLDETHARDFIDDYLIEMKKNGDAKTGLYSRDTLDCTIRDFLGAGSETFQSAMVFSCLVLANHPEMMKRVHDEIDAVLANEGELTYAIREKMPFCHAFTKEILRYRTLGPILFPHCTSKGVNFRGFYIPKGTTILPNAYAVHNDHTYWESPGEFNPERQLDSEGKLKLSKYYVPFGLGPRLCIARRLGEMEVFIFFVALFRKYEVIPKPTSGCKRPHVNDDSSFAGLILNPPENTPVMFVRRN